jgi:putative RecB family exonuclease
LNSNNTRAQTSSAITWISGPPASGKSTLLLGPLREALAAGDFTVRLLVPTATLSEHLRHDLARTGLVLRRNSVGTLTRFLNEIPISLKAASNSQFDAILAEVLTRNCPEEFVPLQESPGFRAKLLACLEELALAGAEPEEVPGPVGRVYTRLRQALAKLGAGLRGQRLEAAAAWLSQAPPQDLPSGRLFLLDGFYRFANTELKFLEALAARFEVRATRVSDSPSSPALRLPQRQPLITKATPLTREQEVLAMAREVLRLAGEGVPLRRIGVVLRTTRVYAPLVENIFARLKIPSRSYVGVELSRHPWMGFVRDWVAAQRSAWDAEKALAALRWSLTGLGNTSTGDSLELFVRENLPAPARTLFPQLKAWESWGQAASSQQLLAEFDRLREWAAAPRALAVNPENAEVQAFHWSQFMEALRQWRLLLELAAQGLAPETKLSAAELWDLAQLEGEAATLRDRDRRREVVHVMDLEESRQWDLDYVFAPGLLEGEFPRRAQPDAFLGEDLRARLGMKTMREREAEEDQLWQVLLTRAHRQLWLSHPLRDSNGEANLPSPYWDQIPGAEAVAPLPWLAIASGPVRGTPAQPTLLPNYRPNKAWSASEMEDYVQCPFAHFARRVMQWEGLPALPSQRLDALLLGTVVHSALEKWLREPSARLPEIAAAEFDRKIAEAGIPVNYAVWMERLNLLRVLSLYEKSAPAQSPGWTSLAEQMVELTLDGNIALRGRVDRLDLSPSGAARIFDYKYSQGRDLEKRFVQSGLYTLATAARDDVCEVQSFTYLALKADEALKEISGERLEEHMVAAAAAARQTAAGVAEGFIAVRPADSKLCQYCEYIDVCRIRTQMATAEDEVDDETAEGAA